MPSKEKSCDMWVYFVRERKMKDTHSNKDLYKY